MAFSISTPRHSKLKVLGGLLGFTEDSISPAFLLWSTELFILACMILWRYKQTTGAISSFPLLASLAHWTLKEQLHSIFLTWMECFPCSWCCALSYWHFQKKIVAEYERNHVQGCYANLQGDCHKARSKVALPGCCFSKHCRSYWRRNSFS